MAIFEGYISERKVKHIFFLKMLLVKRWKLRIEVTCYSSHVRGRLDSGPDLDPVIVALDDPNPNWFHVKL